MLRTGLIPSREAGSKRLMVVLHGLGDSMEGYRFLPEELRLPSMNYLLVNAPDDYYGGYSWYDYEGDAAPGVERSFRLLCELLDAQRTAGFPTEQTVLFGFSQGCLMTIETGCRYPHRLAGLVGVSGYVHDPQTLAAQFSPVAREQRFLLTHGTLDPLIPFAQVRLQVEFLRSRGLHIEWIELVKQHTIAGEHELSVIRSFVEGCFAAA